MPLLCIWKTLHDHAAESRNVWAFKFVLIKGGQFKPCMAWRKQFPNSLSLSSDWEPHFIVLRKKTAVTSVSTIHSEPDILTAMKSFIGVLSASHYCMHHFVSVPLYSSSLNRKKVCRQISRGISRVCWINSRWIMMTKALLLYHPGLWVDLLPIHFDPLAELGTGLASKY